MSRLVTFGCSHTYGEGQIDCLNYDDPVTGESFFLRKPSQYAWPVVLGRELNIEEVINLGRPGASNRYIANRILDTTIQKDDIVVILWTEFNRTTIYPRAGTNWLAGKIIAPTKKNKQSKNYYKYIHHPYNSFLESVEAINLANYALQEHRHVYNFKADFASGRQVWHCHDDTYEYPKWNKVVLINQSLHYVDLAADNDHPGPESQKLIARDVLERIANND